MKRTVLALVAAVVVHGTQTSAHHSFAADYLEDQRVSVEGEVVQIDYRSPHSWVHVNAKDVSGVMRQIGALATVGRHRADAETGRSRRHHRQSVARSESVPDALEEHPPSVGRLAVVRSGRAHLIVFPRCPSA